MKYLNYLFLLLISFSAQAQIEFEEQIISDSSTGTDEIEAFAIGNIDGVGTNEVIVASRMDGKISYYRNTVGTDMFSPQIVIEEGISGLEEIKLADLDNDGDLDLYVLANQFFWYENVDGLGQFGPRIIFNNNLGTIKGLSHADIDNDGDLDIVVTGDVTTWFKNENGSNSFTQQDDVFGVGSNGQNTTTADFDSDGDLDIMIASSERVKWYENEDGLGDFTLKQVVILPGTYNGTNDFKTYVQGGDIDNDGDQDFAVSSYGDNFVAWYPNPGGTGNFNDIQYIDSTTIEVETFALVDIDNNNTLDVCFSHRADADFSRGITAYYNTGAGSFDSEEIITLGGNYHNPMELGDINGDIIIDVITKEYLNTAYWYKGIENSNSFEEARTLSLNTSSVGTAVFADIDGDGDNDLCATVGGGLIWSENTDGQGNFDFINSNLIDINGGANINLGDIDMDGDLDIVYSFGREIGWYTNLDGNGVFSEKQVLYTYNNSASIYDLRLLDIDNDGDLDIYNFKILGINQIGWLENTDGHGTFSDLILIAENINFIDIAFEDVDGDLDKDIVCVYCPGQVLYWIENLDGLGTFDEITGINFTTTLTNRQTLMDADGDGDLDFVVSANNISFSNDIIWSENDGLGNFQPLQILFSTSINAQRSMYSSDIDNDGDMDIFEYNESTDELGWYEHLNGQGSFGPHQYLDTYTNEAFGISFTPVDDDSRKDILFYSDSFDKISWYKNIGQANNSLFGLVRNDFDSNGCTINDQELYNTLITTTNGIDSFSSSTSLEGVYQFFADEGLYTTSVSPASVPPYYDIFPASVNTNFTGVGNTEQIDFCFVPNEVANDLNIVIYPLTESRPGFDTKYALVYNNVGTTQLDGTISFQFDNDKQVYVSASEVPIDESPGMILFEFQNLNPFETSVIEITLNNEQPPVNENGDIVSLTAQIEILGDDVTPEDNTYVFNQVLVGSFDPNDIQVVEGAEIHENEIGNYLHYIIRFQNVGTASAINVRVDNELNSNLDWETIQIETLSHPGRVEIINNNMISFIFDGINLPSSMIDEAGSNGYITYKIRTNSDLEVGNEILNNASIFFDFNQPIFTNIASTTIVNNLGLNNLSIQNTRLYPIPSDDLIFVESDTIIQSISVFNSIGQNFLELKDYNGIREIDVSKFKSGIYFLAIEDISKNKLFKKIIIK